MGQMVTRGWRAPVSLSPSSGKALWEGCAVCRQSQDLSLGCPQGPVQVPVYKRGVCSVGVTTDPYQPSLGCGRPLPRPGPSQGLPPPPVAKPQLQEVSVLTTEMGDSSSLPLFWAKPIFLTSLPPTLRVQVPT